MDVLRQEIGGGTPRAELIRKHYGVRGPLGSESFVAHCEAAVGAEDGDRPPEE